MFFINNYGSLYNVYKRPVLWERGARVRPRDLIFFKTELHSKVSYCLNSLINPRKLSGFLFEKRGVIIQSKRLVLYRYCSVLVVFFFHECRKFLFWSFTYIFQLCRPSMFRSRHYFKLN